MLSKLGQVACMYDFWILIFYRTWTAVWSIPPLPMALLPADLSTSNSSRYSTKPISMLKNKAKKMWMRKRM